MKIHAWIIDLNYEWSFIRVLDPACQSYHFISCMGSDEEEGPPKKHWVDSINKDYGTLVMTKTQASQSA